MAKTVFEEMGGTYTQVGNYFIPCFTLPTEKKQPIGLFGKRHLRYLKEHHKVIYTNLLTSGKLNAYLADIDRWANDMFFRLVKEFAEKENVTEKLKATNQMLWAQKVNNICNSATEIVNTKIIYMVF